MLFASEAFYAQMWSFKLSTLTESQLNGLLVAVLNLEDGYVFSEHTLMEDLPNLDSLRFMRMMNEIEAVTGTTLSAEDLMDVETVGDLRRLVAGVSGVAG